MSKSVKVWSQVRNQVLDQVRRIETYEMDGKTYLRIKESVELVHEDHTNHTIAPGDYEVTIQRE
jgi:hypothetical protein